MGVEGPKEREKGKKRVIHEEFLVVLEKKSPSSYNIRL